MPFRVGVCSFLSPLPIVVLVQLGINLWCLLGESIISGPCAARRRGVGRSQKEMVVVQETSAKLAHLFDVDYNAP